MIMRNFSLIWFLLFISLNNIAGQTRTVSGRIIDEDLETVPQALINSTDTILIDKTDLDGLFHLQIPIETKELLIGCVGMEWKVISLSKDCENIDIVLMYSANYDFKSHRKVDRLRKERFNKLSEIHELAYKKGLFSTEKPFYDFGFEPIKQRLDEIRRIRRTKIPST